MSRKPRTEVILPPPPSPDEQADELIVDSTTINAAELLERMREFENKVLLDRLKVLERMVTITNKQQMANKKLLEEILGQMNDLSTSVQELQYFFGEEMSGLIDDKADGDYPDADINPTPSSEESKKWN